MLLAKTYQLSLLVTVVSLTEPTLLLPISVAADTILAMSWMIHAPD